MIKCNEKHWLWPKGCFPELLNKSLICIDKISSQRIQEWLKGLHDQKHI